MKILQVVSSFKPAWETGGTNRVVYEHSRSLVEKGHKVTVFTTDRGRKRVNSPKNRPVIVDNIQVYYFRNISNYLARKKIITPYYLPLIARKEVKEFDIIHVHEPRTLVAPIIHHYAVKYSIPYVLQAHGSLTTFFQKRWLKRTFDVVWGYQILKDASKLVAVTKTEAEQYKSMGVNEDKIEIIPNGIDLFEFDNLPQKGEFKGKYGLGDDQRILLYLGRINKIKGLDLLARGFADLSSTLKDIKLVMVGPDDGYLSSLQKLVTTLEISDKVLFTGPLYGREKLEAYVDAEVYVLPSFYETFPVAVLEAFACGIPVIVTDRCGIADVINGQAGLVVPYDKDQLKHALLKMLEDTKMRQGFGEKGRLLVREKYNWGTIAGQIERLYLNCLSPAQ